MNNKKEQEREELHKVIWKAATDFVHGGKVSAWDFKEYFLGIMFYRFISENIENYINEIQRKAGEVGFEYRNLSDEEALIGKSQILEEKGLFILPSELFCNIRKTAKNNENLNVILSNTFDNIESSARGYASENDVKGLFDSIDMTSNKIGETVSERNENLEKLLNVIGELPLGDYKSNTIDLFGDAYEYLMNMYASTAGKKGGEYFTPQEVGELLAKIVIMDKKEVNKVYDPACGSGGLLLKFAKILGKENVKQGFYGQEINLTTYNLARINMFLHDINYNKFDIAREDTLIHPAHWDDEPFDAIVSNPPYSIPWIGSDNPILINDERFAPAGVLAPKNKADLAFTMHMLSWLSPKGTAAIVEFAGVLRRGGAEQKIRQYMVDNNFVDTVIQLPLNLFYGTGIATCILVLKKNKSDTNILFVDASEYFVKNSNKNKLSDDNIETILEIVKSRKNIDSKSSLTSYEDVRKNNYDLSVNSYVNISEETEEIDYDKLSIELEKCELSQKEIKDELHQIIGNQSPNEVINKIMKDSENEIKYMPLKDCCIFQNGFAFKSNLFKETGEKVVRITNISNNIIDLSDVKCIDLSDYKENLDNYIIDKDEIVIAMSGATTGKIGINNTTEKLYLNQRVGKIVGKEGMLDNHFLYHILLSKVNYFYSLAGGGAQPNLSSDAIRNTILPVPPMNIQKEIVKILDLFNSLEKELDKERNLRRKQYEFYKNLVVSFEERGEDND